MKWPGPVVPARFLKRYKRFFADFALADGTVVTAHCANTGSMKTCTAPDAPSLLTFHDDPKRKLQYSWQAIQLPDGWVGINTGLANGLVREALAGGMPAELAAYGSVRPEQKYGDNSRIDFLLQGKGLPDCYVEVKNVTLLLDDGVVGFPDAVTARGTKHLEALARLPAQGLRAVLVYCVQRTGAHTVRLAQACDPVYAAALRAAVAAGVEVVALRADIDNAGATLRTRLPFQFGEDTSTAFSPTP